MSQFETFLQELAGVFKFSSLKPDSNGACQIVMKEGQIPLLFEFDEQLVPNTILLSCPIAPLPIEHRADVYEASLVGNATLEETLSIKPDEDMLFLHRRLHPQIKAADIEKIIQSFLETVKTWKVRVLEISRQPPRSSKLPPHPSAIIFPYKA